MSWQDILAEILNEVKRNQIITQVIAKVETPPPELTLRYSEQVIPSKQIYCSNYLLPHYHRDYTIDGIIDNIEVDVSEYDFDNETSSSAVPQHPSHPIPKLSGSGSYKGNGKYKTHGDIWFEDTLKVGDEVLVNIVGVFWVVVSKITKMPAGAEDGV